MEKENETEMNTTVNEIAKDKCDETAKNNSDEVVDNKDDRIANPGDDRLNKGRNSFGGLNSVAEVHESDKPSMIPSMPAAAMATVTRRMPHLHKLEK